MSYTVILIAFVFFLSSMLLHVIIWRFFKPRRLVRALFIVLLFIPALAVFSIIFFLSNALGLLTSDWLGVLLMHLVLTSAYIISYPAIQAKCPSLTMLLLIEDSAGHGSTVEDISLAFSDESLREARLNDLVDDSMIVCRGDEYYMTLKGGLHLWPLIILRRLLGLPTGKG